jgi:hypothetical protein
MARPLRIISIDGTRGAGKTSQIAMLSRYFKSIGFQVSTLKMTDGDPIQSGIIALNYIESFLPKGDNTMVILDGSIARPMVADIITGMSNTNLLEKFKLLTHAYERVDHKYGIACFLMVMDDMQECNRRIEKFKSLTGIDANVVEDLIQERDIINGMRFFNNHIASKNIQFQVLDIEPHHSMLEIHKTIMGKLSDKYEFAKPKKDDNEW